MGLVCLVNATQGQANFHRSWAWQIVKIFNTAYIRWIHNRPPISCLDITIKDLGEMSPSYSGTQLNVHFWQCYHRSENWIQYEWGSSCHWGGVRNCFQEPKGDVTLVAHYWDYNSGWTNHQSSCFGWVKYTVWYKTKVGSQNFGYQLWCLFCNICNVFKSMFNVPLIITW